MLPRWGFAEDAAASYAKAAIDWKQFAGQTITLAGAIHPWSNAITPLLWDFTKLTGIIVATDFRLETAYLGALPIQLNRGSSTPDVFMWTTYGQGISAGWLEPLNAYYSDKSLTDLGWYDESDLLKTARAFPLWSDRERYAVPITSEAVTLFVNSDARTARNLPIPQTFEALLATAKAVKTSAMSGIAMRAQAGGNSSVPAMSFVFSYGGHMVKDNKAAFASPEAIAAVEMFGQLLSQAGPVGVGSYEWYHVLDDFLQGRTAMAIDSSNFATDISNPAKSRVTKQLEGETGTGKELLARALHYNGPRKERPCIAVNCGALPEALVESELFGHKKGAFSGAISDKLGLIEAANGGTLFLDEIGEMPLSTQVKLLRALQEGEIRRVGETQDRQVDVRLISATNKDLAQEVQQKRFREDLYYRINVFLITVPQLRERPEDIPLLVTHFIRKCSAKQGKHVAEITQSVLALFTQYAWPGNVRELENEIERAVALTPDGQPILSDVLSERIVNQQSLRVPLPVVNSSLKEARSAFEREYIADLLFKNQGNAAKTAKLLGLSRQMLQKRIKEFGLRDR